MQNKNGYTLVSDKPIEWAADTVRGFFGYQVHAEGMPENIGFPAFTHEQMQEAKRINETLGARYSWDEFPHLLYDAGADTWNEVYYSDLSDVEDVMQPFYVDGLKLYALGALSGWAWGEVDDDTEEFMTSNGWEWITV